ncbi:AfsA-related hotdog domain-containing protein [Ideonella sp. DXS29W]|uniref:AfsA-related hotdog domain-containing protein n=1 Tax=Ideonella lacteola TaxID=2984193 RepID=A0ABU9BXG6_9BURK
MKTVFIVGNKFKDFSRHDGVITIGEFSDMARTGTFDRLPDGTRLAAGQGVREAEIQAICDQAQHALAERGIDMGPALRRSVRASRLQTHKHRIQNAIISHPVRIDDRCFEAALLLDERSELMADHQTGQHIQGMILIEAARQLFLAVTEEYFIGQTVHDRYYFVINSVDVKFTGFVFPIEATLRYEIVSQDIANPARLRFDTLISVMQGGTCATQIAFSFTAFHASKIEAKEQQQAQALLMRQRQPNPEAVPLPAPVIASHPAGAALAPA